MEYFASPKKTIAAALLALAAIAFSLPAVAELTPANYYIYPTSLTEGAAVSINGVKTSIDNYRLVLPTAGVSFYYLETALVCRTEQVSEITAVTPVGMRFVGWYGYADGPVLSSVLPDQRNFTKQISTNPTENLTTLGTARKTSSGWTLLQLKFAIADYRVGFDAVGGIANQSQFTVRYNGTYPEMKDATRTGYTFDGWFTKAEGGVQIRKGDLVTADLAHDQTLYAHWTPITCTVSFNANGGSPSVTIKETYNSPYVLPTPPTRAGYTFAGWYTAASGGSQVTEGNTVSIITEQTLYAHWTAKTYTVSFNANGGSVDTSSKSVTYDSSYGTLPTPTRTGYSFDGWYTLATGGSKVTSSTIFTATSNQTLYAHWTPISYTVSFNANGGSGTMRNLTLTYDQSVALTANAFSRTGYTFAGWATTSSGSVAYTDKASVKNLRSTSGSYSLYAIWTPITYTVSFNASGGTVEMNSKSVTYDSTYGDLPVPTRTGYAFDGWYNAESVRIYSTTSVKITANQTLYAHWTANSYEVTFQSQETSWSTRISETYGESYRLPNSNPTRTGYEFAGWYTAEGLQLTEADTVSITTAQTLYAHWTPLTYTVAFDANGGKGEMNGQTLTYGESETLTANAFSRIGYEFAGWAEYPYGNVRYDDQAEVVNLSSTAQPITLYAKWTPLTYAIETEGTNCTISAPTSGAFGSEIQISWSPTSVVGYTLSFDSATFEGIDKDLGHYTLTVVANETGAHYTMKDHYYQSLSVKVAYAKTPKKFTVYLEPEGGEIATRQKTVTYDSTYGDLGTPTRAGYTFAGWWTADGDEVTAETTVKILSNQTLYAHWRYQIAFAKGVDDDSVTGTMTNVTAECAKTWTLPANGYSRVGYRFGGWLSGKTLFADAAEVSSDLPLTEGVAVLTAQWEPIKYKITFDANWFTPGTLQTPILTNVVEKSYAVACSLPKWSPVNTLAEKFLGWAASPTGDVIVTDGGTLTEDLSEGDDVTLYAIWQMPDMTLSKAVGCTNLVLKSAKSEFGTYSSIAEKWTVNANGVGIQSGTITLKNNSMINPTLIRYAYSELTAVLVNQPGRLTFTWRARTAKDGLCEFCVNGVPHSIATTDETTVVYTNTVADQTVALSWRAHGENDPTPSNLVITSLKWEPLGEHPEPTEKDRPVIGSDFTFETNPDFDYVIWKKSELTEAEWTKLETVTGNGDSVALPMFDGTQGFFKVEVIQRESK